MPRLLYVTFHGGSGGIRNIAAWDGNGGDKPAVADVLDTSQLDHDLDELRGFLVVADGTLYLANSYKTSGASPQSVGEILHFDVPGGDGIRPYLGAFCAWSEAGNPGLQHPFDAVLGPDGNVYVANQGQKADPESTNAVTSYHGPGSSQAGQPLPTPHAIYPGTFVGPDAKAKHGVKVLRDAVFGPSKDGQDCLYLSDEKRKEVRRYSSSGAYLDSPVTGGDGLDKPVHLLVSRSGKHLYVGSQGNNSVLSLEVASGKVSTLVDSSSGIDSTAGLAEDEDGWLYVASRKGRQVLRFDHKTGKPDAKPFIASLGDNPEFIMWI
ncbi:hypothetical protein OJF2_66140 [Aquisphaera giovannonii]|uniref:Uncharacterized protein n=1 Tax=Aquisphaera giovannonii TaxID=406548 RepID=A0A5B9WBG3_9BACT|nr:hypothetical protein [Aquisphaera giovannonii]QEH38018.1 hypothetical protein OJF2_66140 [Aquisphaera giovannonii]